MAVPEQTFAHTVSGPETATEKRRAPILIDGAWPIGSRAPR